MSETFLVGVSHDLAPAGGPDALDALGMSKLRADPRVRWEFMSTSGAELSAEAVHGYDAIVLLRPAVTAATLAQTDRLCLIARWGVGYDNVDVDACTDAGVIVTITPDAVRRPVATGALALILALTHRVVEKDHAARTGGWSNRLDTLGVGLTGRVLGVVGLGNIGRELLDLTRPFGMRVVASDPYVSAETASAVGADLVPMEELLATADVVCLTCALTLETYHLMNAERIAMMKADAYLVNVARGGLVDQAALTNALRNGEIRGAALDTLEHEPPRHDDPLLALDNVILMPHSIAWTDHLAQGNTASSCQAILDVIAGCPPQHVVNPDVVQSAALAAKLRRHDIQLRTGESLWAE